MVIPDDWWPRLTSNARLRIGLLMIGLALVVIGVAIVISGLT